MAQCGLLDRVNLVVGPVNALPEDRFDGASCSLVTHFCQSSDQRSQIFRAISRRLNDSAPCFVSELCGGDDRLTPWFEKAWKVGAVERGIASTDLDRILSGLGSEVFLLKAQISVQLLRESGFVRVTQVFQSHAVFGWLAERSRTGRADEPTPV